MKSGVKFRILDYRSAKKLTINKNTIACGMKFFEIESLEINPVFAVTPQKPEPKISLD